MKKITALIAFALLMTSSAYAVTGSITMANPIGTTGGTLYAAVTGVGTTSPVIAKTSTGVGVSVTSNSTAYAVMTQHKTGTKAFGTSFDATAIYTVPVTTAGVPVITSALAASSAQFTTGSWVTM